MDTKSKVLSRLEQSKGAPVSGTVIAEDLKISRTAVWKAINSLRDDGHIIDSNSGLGYTLAMESDKLTQEGISSLLNDLSLMCTDTERNDLQQPDCDMMDIHVAEEMGVPS